MVPQKIVPFLWFDSAAEEAVAFYVSLFPDSAITSTTPGPDGRARVVAFRLAGSNFLALNGGPHFKFTEAISLAVSCETQAEVDDLWAKLTAGGAPGQCGWLKDRYGLSWQIVPEALPRLLNDPDRERAGRAMGAMMGITKIDIAALEKAARGE